MSKPRWKIPLFASAFGREELEAVQQPLRNNWLTLGAVTQSLETDLAKLLGARHVVAVTNGTAALHLALVAAGVGAGDEVIVPALTFVASANAARYCGARVVFADIRSDTDLTIDPEDVAGKITKNTRAIVAVHYAGFPADMTALATLAREHDLAVVEDCAHALVTRVDGRALGTLASAGCFSFFSNKNMTSAEGGAFVTDDDAIADKVRRLRSHGMTSMTLDRYEGRAWSYDVVDLGWNYRIDEIRASLARVQLDRLPDFLAGRRDVRKWYLEDLGQTPVTVPFTRWDDDAASDIGYHIMPVVLRAGTDRTAVMQHLKSRGIQSSVHYPPAHRFTAVAAENHPALPVTDAVAPRQLTLPFYPTMRREDVGEVCASLKEALERTG